MSFKLFGKTLLVVNIQFGLFWAIHSASEMDCTFREDQSSGKQQV